MKNRRSASYKNVDLQELREAFYKLKAEKYPNLDVSLYGQTVHFGDNVAAQSILDFQNDLSRLLS